MRIRTFAVTAVLGVALIGVWAAPSYAAPRSGVIEVRKSITLNFPKPGVYYGVLRVGKPSIRKVARLPGTRKKAGKKERRRASRAARSACLRGAKNLLVEVVHLSKPPFTIGADSPSVLGGGGALRYTVTGPEPPTGDKVLARQRTSRHKTFGQNAIFMWKIRCLAAKVIKPYPY